MTLHEAIALTIVGSAITSVSWVFQKQAARALPRIASAPARETLVAFLTSGRWLGGLGLMVTGFACFQTAVALTGEISILQPMFGVGSAMLAVCAVVFLEERFSALEWAALVLLVAALAALGLTARPHEPHLVPGGVLGVFVVLACVALVWRGLESFAPGLSPEFVLGVGGGAVQGLGLVLMGAYSFHQRTGGPWWTVLLLPCAIACFAGSFVSLQSGVQVGRALVVVTLNTVCTNLVAIAGGILILGEHLPDDPQLRTLQMVALTVIVAASGVLARLGTPPAGGRAAAAPGRSEVGAAAARSTVRGRS